MRLLARWIGAVLERDLSNQEILAAKDAAEAAQSNLALEAHKLAQSNADLEQFAYVASHDLRTPLRNIISYSQLLEHRYKERLDSDADEFIGFIVDNGKRMTVLITDLLEYSRIASQSKQLMPVAAADSLRQALDNLRTTIEEEGVEISVGAMPVVMSEPSLMVSLFQNLLGNGIKYRHPDRKPRLSVAAQRLDDGPWRFSVADNGIGIEPQYFDKIFEIFQRLAPNSDTVGTGIGLAMCRRIVHRCNGAIWLESNPDGGTTFFFTLEDGAVSPRV
ncbi:hypothetical protein CU669_13895 [Paramagnetospirillum kuznetsovii]|uniref:histidine kinase n=2 Tax=Paramagnetospirillum kuznetsovii TaxID=2053833 RepID=A0A364NWJ0_9PROT|nr:hypothetical protein CU669_13895 [Paramagnetospirillum kuznetsovii]